LIKDFFPHNPIDRSEIDNAIDGGNEGTQECSEGGQMSQHVNSSSNQISLNYQNCSGEGLVINGTESYVLDHEENGKKADYFFLDNLNITGNGKDFSQEMAIKAYQEGGKDKWDIYSKVSGNVPTGSIEINVYVTRDGDKVSFEAVYLLGDGNYLEVHGSKLTLFSVPWLGPDAESLFAVGDEWNGVINIDGDRSVIEFVRLGDKPVETLHSEGSVYYWDTFTQKWTTDIEDIVPNDYDPLIFLYSENGDSFLNQHEIKVFAGNSKRFYFQIEDFDTYHYQHKITLEMTAKPSGSQILFPERHWEYSDSYRHDDPYTDTYQLISASFDQEGKYSFRLTVQDGSRMRTIDFSFFYYKEGLEDNQYMLESNMLDAVYIPGKDSVAILSSSPEKAVRLFNMYGELTETLELDKKPEKMAFDSNASLLAISSDAKVLIVDVNNSGKLTLNNTYSITAKLGKIAIDSGFVYVIDKTSVLNKKLCSLRLSDGNITEISDKFRMPKNLILNHEQKSLYILDTYGSPENIVHFDLASGFASYSHNSPDHYSYYFGENMWKLTDSQLLTATGVHLTMANDQEHDMEYNGTLESESNRNIWAMNIDDRNHTFAIAFGPSRKNYVTEEQFFLPYKIEIRSLGDEHLIKKMSADRYYSDGKTLYQLFVEKVFLGKGNKIFILYRAVLNGRYWHDPSKDIFIYEVREI
jgi:hypothetical protein